MHKSIYNKYDSAEWNSLVAALLKTSVGTQVQVCLKFQGHWLVVLSKLGIFDCGLITIFGLWLLTDLNSWDLYLLAVLN